MSPQDDQPADTSPRARLLAAAVDHVAGHGVTGLSLRELAAAVGTSHRMLIHHFGSKEGLLVEVVRAVEARQRAALAELQATSDVSLEEAGRRFWERLTDPSLDRHERLFFELYGQALQGRPWAASLLDGIVDDWIRPLCELLVAAGRPAATASADARLALAVARGLLLDLLATGDRAGVTAAMERFQSYLLSQPR
ncbi:MAG TPA: TetR/AcrR family transcriptional regulator [Acidimicrobiales bacterium]|jgi:AcrR family transcriptional regulator